MLPVDWNRNQAVKRLVEHAASPENRPAQGTRSIIQFADRQHDDREVALLSVYAGLLMEVEALRGFLIEGIRQYVLRAKILEENIQGHETALLKLSESGNEAERLNRQSYDRARLADARYMDDAMEEAEFLCHRYAYLDKKLRLLTKTIRDSI
ncbi:MAG: hypothetical protein GY703_25635 [Gammaproteobacteria bacterium]|nr:hypothetical protein [Gammaproteobacteria bacterium]